MIENTLRSSGFDHTLLIRMTGVGKSQLTQRAALANAAKVDLFISIHHDDVQPLYYQRWTHNGQTYHFSDRYMGYSIFISQKNAYPTESLLFARLLGAQLKAHGLAFTTHHAENLPGERRQLLDAELGVYRYDQLIVLKQTKAPSVLLEAGIIVNRNEEQLLSSPQRQQVISESVLTATRQFCAEQQERDQ